MKRYIEKTNATRSKVNSTKILKNVDLNVARKTVNNWSLRKNYFYKKKVRKIQLTKDHKINRILQNFFNKCSQFSVNLLCIFYEHA